MEDYTPDVFLGLPAELFVVARARFVIVPVPYEGTVCFQGGTSLGPRAIIDVSPQMEWFDEDTRREFVEAGIATDEAIDVDGEVGRVVEAVYERVGGWFDKGKFPLLLGGEHSISFGAVRAAAQRHNNLSVLQFDAHADLRDEYTGGKFSHASVMRRVLEITPDIVQVGIRSFSGEEAAECPAQIAKIITPRMVRDDAKGAIAAILERLTDNVYVTFDMDAFDPAYAPGVGTPEPGGLNWFEVVDILGAVIERKNVVGADVVETMPLGGKQITTEFLAARLAAKIIALVSRD